MNDRFKFRVWCKSLEKYVDNVNLLQTGVLCFTGSSFGFIDDNYIIEQCTSLKDKNGNLIYEGDIVKFGASGLLRGVVKFGEYENCIPCGDDNVYCSCVGWYLDDGCDTYPLNDTQLEITGNIH